ncbi:MAG: hypothetical protein PVS3B3_10670 [Ktedonobacteraceae bacterium]
MLAEELHIVNADAPSWQAVRPILSIALLLERDDTYVWHGWNKAQILALLNQLPVHCTILAGVWSIADDEQQNEVIVFSCVCEVVNGEVQTVRTFEALTSADLPTFENLEPGFEDAQKIMRVVRSTIAPVAWALFTDKNTWDEWVYTGNEHVVDKGELLASFAQQGRCVLMGSQTQHYTP